MPLMAYCVKCAQEVEPGPACPLCGRKLPKTRLQVSWAYPLTPVTDVFSWRRLLRVALPALLLFALAILGVEGAIRGWVGLQALLAGSFPPLMAKLSAIVLFVCFAALLLRGREEVVCILHHEGVFLQTRLRAPTPIQRLLHRAVEPIQTDELGRQVWLLPPRYIPWQRLCRVRTLPERGKILLYSPRFWLCMTLPCLPEAYRDAEAFLYAHVKKRPGVMAAPSISEESPSQV